MAKKKDTSIRIVGAFALVLGIVAFCMMFVKAAKIDVGVGNLSGELLSFTGAQLAFGYAEGGVQLLNFNILAFLAFFLPLIGGVLALLFKNGLITKIVTTGCFVAGAVFMFTMVAGMDVGFAEGFSQAKDAFSLGAGAIAGGVLSIVGAVVCFFKGTIAKIFSK